MCGTPFPQRALTVPEDQSTLAFGSAPLEIPASTLQVHEVATAAAAVAEEPQEQVDEVLAEPRSAEVGEVVTAELPDSVVEEVPEALLEATTEEVYGMSPELVIAEGRPVVAEVKPATVEAETGVVEEPIVARMQQATEEVAPPEKVEVPTREVQKPAAKVVVMPTWRPQPALVEQEEEAAPRPVVIRPTPEFTPPPSSAGMPTFKEVVEAAGPPPISPFEPPTEKHPDEERELKEFVASFRWTPPEETADELTMRSEIPVIDKEEPAEFHHPSFDEDVPPPREAGAHPTGEEYYPASHGTEGSRFLEISDAQEPSAASGGVPPGLLEEVPAAKSNNRWLWASIAALVLLVALFGGWGFLEGRAQVTPAFRGPVQFVRDEYISLRQWIAQKTQAPAVAPATPKAEVEKNAAPPGKPVSPEKADALEPEETKSAPTETMPSKPAATVDTSKVEPPKEIQPPPPSKPSSKPQPGQEELAKAMNASDATAAAAWLWKATSRGNPEAPVRLADMYIKGNGVPKSCEQALVLLRSAATKENAPARNRLAALYANGTCVVRDRVKAYQLMSSALTADPSSEWAKENMQQLWNQMTPAERAEAQKYR